jgi:hypothetical protein
MSTRRWRAPAGLGATVAALVACAACTPASSPDGPPIAAVHRHQCGRCHPPPAPGAHTRAQLEDAFSRHKTRVRLSPDEWTAMVDYLAAPDGSTTLR